MSLAQRLLYHQIHPAKLIADPIAGALCLLLLWRHHSIAALAVLLAPLGVSVWLVTTVNLSPYRSSVAGRYLRRFQTWPVQALRLAGFGLSMLGAWRHDCQLPAGILLVLTCWLYGFLVLAWQR